MYFYGNWLGRYNRKCNVGEVTCFGIIHFPGQEIMLRGLFRFCVFNVRVWQRKTVITIRTHYFQNWHNSPALQKDITLLK